MEAAAPILHICSFFIIIIDAVFNFALVMVILSYRWEFIGTAFINIYITILYIFAVKGVYRHLKRKFPQLMPLYQRIITCTALGSGISPILRCALLIFESLYCEYLDSEKKTQILDLLVQVLFELLPLCFTFLKLWIEVRYNKEEDKYSVLINDDILSTLEKDGDRPALLSRNIDDIEEEGEDEQEEYQGESLNKTEIEG